MGPMNLGIGLGVSSRGGVGAAADPPAAVGGGIYTTSDQQRYVGDLAPDGKEGTLILCVKMSAGSDAAFQQWWITGGTQRFFITRSFTNQYTIEGDNAAGANILKLTQTGTITVADSWECIIASWDLANAKGHLYHGNTDRLTGGATLTNDTIEYTNDQANFSGNSSGGNRGRCCYSEVLFHNKYIDISNAGVRATVVDAVTGFPVYWGADGSTPFGEQPLWYSPTADFVGNQLGSKPAMTQQAGTYATCAGPNA